MIKLKRPLGVYSLKLKIALMCLALSLTVALVLYSIQLQDAQRILQLKLEQDAYWELGNAVKKLETSISSIRSLFYFISSSEDFQSLLRNPDANAKRRLQLSAELDEKLIISQLRPYTNKLLITSLQQPIITRGILSGSPDDCDRLKALPDFERLFNKDGLGGMGICLEPLTYSSQQTDVIPLGRKIYNGRNQVIGYIYLSLNTEILTEFMANDDGFYIALGEQTYRSNGDRFQPCEWPRYQSTAQEGIVRLLQGGSRRTAVTAKLYNADWQLLQLVPQANLTTFSRREAILLLVLVASFIFGVSLLMMEQMITKPISRMQRQMDIVADSDCSLSFAIEQSSREFMEISRGVENLRSKLHFHMEELLESERKRRHLEFEMLQAQVNPHFICNSLNTIKWMADMQQSPGISEMAVSLSSLFRKVLSTQDNLISLKEEMEIVDMYVTIQRYRYKDIFTFEKEISDVSLLNSLIPRFTFQPLIENAIFHGIASRHRFGSISLTIQQKTRTVEAVLFDNGAGMSPEMIETALHQEKEDRHAFNHIGLKNVNERLKYEFGPEYGLTIESVLGEYTRILLRYPMRILAENQQLQEG